jgi:hypothetical protein
LLEPGVPACAVPPPEAREREFEGAWKPFCGSVRCELPRAGELEKAEDGCPAEACPKEDCWAEPAAASPPGAAPWAAEPCDADPGPTKELGAEPGGEEPAMRPVEPRAPDTEAGEERKFDGYGLPSPAELAAAPCALPLVAGVDAAPVLGAERPIPPVRGCM